MVATNWPLLQVVGNPSFEINCVTKRKEKRIFEAWPLKVLRLVTVYASYHLSGETFAFLGSAVSFDEWDFVLLIDLFSGMASFSFKLLKMSQKITIALLFNIKKNLLLIFLIKKNWL